MASALIGSARVGGCAPAPDPPAAPPPAPTAAVAPAGPFTTLDEVVRWTRDASGGQCADARTATMPEFTTYLGADRAKLYEPFVASWATCSVPPFAKVGLVLFKPGGLTGLQES